jgi:hypothetical protein
VLARYLAGTRFFCPHWLQMRMAGIYKTSANTELTLNIGCEEVHHTPIHFALSLSPSLFLDYDECQPQEGP